MREPRGEISLGYSPPMDNVKKEMRILFHQVLEKVIK
ncbi:hypothetical protein SPACI_038220 [Sporomusa acidovorans DSM 3132]|uniref:Uncharacterized protein n=1 Tax=Sporomusa acidovorans (strain ATCC 49682 / DSM 3132 / Mol) TaxID=1123286 RepID=A0ABZ3J612_SPOA4|nr:hypothetical protein SPACI_01390 [Sporomusa acidovorans DSM 3132]SDF77028.1 hypothetical protein SAMN04488499_10804 [Sporomusa acidovorans]